MQKQNALEAWQAIDPGKQTQLIFKEKNMQRLLVRYMHEALNYDLDTAKEELPFFLMYWTEPTPNGKKQRWQLQKTFEVVRRFATWMRYAQQRKKKKNFTSKSITI